MRRAGPVQEVLGIAPDAPASASSSACIGGPAGLERAIRAALEEGAPYEADSTSCGPMAVCAGRGAWPRQPARQAGPCTRLTGVLLDITERKQAEDELALSRRRLARELAASRRLHECRRGRQRSAGGWLQRVLDGALPAVDLVAGRCTCSIGDRRSLAVRVAGSIPAQHAEAAACARRDAGHARERAGESLFECLACGPQGERARRRTAMARSSSARVRAWSRRCARAARADQRVTLYADARRGRRGTAPRARPAGARGDGAGERRRADAQLRDSEERFRALAKASPGLIWQSDAEGRPVYLYPRYRELLGLTDEVLAAWHTILHPADAPAYIHALERALRRRAPLHHEVRVRHPAERLALAGVLRGAVVRRRGPTPVTPASRST